MTISGWSCSKEPNYGRKTVLSEMFRVSVKREEKQKWKKIFAFLFFKGNQKGIEMD